MKWLNRLAALLFGLISVGVVRDFFNRYTFVMVNNEDLDEDVKHIVNLKPENYDNAMDLRGTPTQVCPCGCVVWNLKVIFDDSQIASYFLDMECANCGSLATAPTPVEGGMDI